VTTVREQVLSEFIDAWNAGKRPDVDEYVARVPKEEQDVLGQELLAFLTFAPTPEYSDETLSAIEAEPAVIETLRASSRRGGLLPDLLKRLRERAGLSMDEVAGEIVGELGLADDRMPKTAGYLEQLEAGRLEPARVSRRVFEALGRVLGLAGSELEGAADSGGWTPVPVAQATPAPVFRARRSAAEAARRHLDVLADALAAPGGEARDEVDELFLGGR
jgi:transcriptional regulator with XRE-family HTH domain